METIFFGEGNVGRSPEIQAIPVKDQGDPVLKAEISVRILNQSYNSSSSEYEDKGGFWAIIEVWGKLAEHVVRTVSKGDLIVVGGSLRIDEFERKKGDNAGTTGTKNIIRAKHIGLHPRCIESISRRRSELNKTSSSSDLSPAQAQAAPAPAAAAHAPVGNGNSVSPDSAHTQVTQGLVSDADSYQQHPEYNQG